MRGSSSIARPRPASSLLVVVAALMGCGVGCGGGGQGGGAASVNKFMKDVKEKAVDGAGKLKTEVGKATETIKADVQKKATELKEQAQGKTAGSSSKASPSAATTKARQTPPQKAGTMQLTVGGTQPVSQCYANFAAAHGPRPAVLQIRSYSAPHAESFPSVVIQARLPDATSTRQLVGKPLVAVMYFQESANAQVWSGRNVQLEVQTFEGKTLTGKIVGGTLATTDSGATANASGTFTGHLP